MISVMPQPALKPREAFREKPVADDAPEVSTLAAIVLAGMQTWEDSILTRHTPRPLLPVAGQPLITHGLNWIASSGIPRISICTDQDAMTVCQVLDPHLPPALEVDYYQDVLPRGPAGCARDAMERCDAELFLVTEGSTIARLDVDHLLHRHRETDADLTMVVARSDASLTVREKVLEPVGVYLMSREALLRVRPNGYQDIKEILIPELRRQGMSVCTYAVDADHVRQVTGSGTYLRVNEWFLETAGEEWSPGPKYKRFGEGWKHNGAHVHETAQIVGPVLLQAGAVIGPKAVIVGPAVVGPRTQVGPEAVVCRSLLWAGCQIGARAHLDRCVLMDRATITPGIALRGRVCMGEVGIDPLNGHPRPAGESKDKKPSLVDLPSLNWFSPNGCTKVALRTAPLRHEASGRESEFGNR